jgi:asparagine synthase (glutamine-hydrolysing)
MCGIAGIFHRDPRQPVSADRVGAMCDMMTHRGPDDSGVFVEGPVGLGMRRLSIIDLAGGHQPMSTSDGRFTIVFNGEIYNYRDIRRSLEARGDRFQTSSDTEVILQVYRRFGPACLQQLNGMFALALWDATERTLFLARDRVGIKPLYLHENGSELVFASEIKSLLAAGGVPSTLNEEALHYFLRYGYVPSSASLLASVRQLLPGHFMLVSPTGTVTKEYWSVDYTTDTTRTEAEWAEVIYYQLRRAVERQLVSHVPLGAFLSGGLDSSSMVSVMSDVTAGKVNTYSIGFEGKDTFHSELDDARMVARRFGTRHHEIVVKPDVASLLPQLVYHLDQPLADSSFLVTYLVSTLASQTVKVIISGVGGDEIFGGYRRYLGPRLGALYRRVPAQLRRWLASVAPKVSVDRGSSARNLARLGRTFVTGFELPPYEQYDHSVQMLADAEIRRLCPWLSGAKGLLQERRSYFEGIDADDPITPLLHLDLKTSLVDSLLLLTDKMTMATSLEARVPLLDHALIEVVARVPTALKVKGTQLRYIQKRAMDRRLPREIIERKKRGFGCPIGRWFRGELRELLHDTLAPGALRKDGLFDAAVILGLIEAHDRYREDRSDTLLALVTFQIWHAQFKQIPAADTRPTRRGIAV